MSRRRIILIATAGALAVAGTGAWAYDASRSQTLEVAVCSPNDLGPGFDPSKLQEPVFVTETQKARAIGLARADATLSDLLTKYGGRVIGVRPRSWPVPREIGGPNVFIRFKLTRPLGTEPINWRMHSQSGGDCDARPLRWFGVETLPGVAPGRDVVAVVVNIPRAKLLQLVPTGHSPSFGKSPTATEDIFGTKPSA